MVLPDDFCRLEKHLGQVTDILYCCEVCGIPRPALWVAAADALFPEHRKQMRAQRKNRHEFLSINALLGSFILYISLA
jgi:hypothetical protein